MNQKVLKFFRPTDNKPSQPAPVTVSDREAIKKKRQEILAVREKSLAVSTGEYKDVISDESVQQVKRKVQNSALSIARGAKLSCTEYKVDATERSIQITLCFSAINQLNMDDSHILFLEKAAELGVTPDWLGQAFVYKGKFYVFNGLVERKGDYFFRLTVENDIQMKNVLMRASENVVTQLRNMILEYKEAVAFKHQHSEIGVR